jgi:hypothetical protein
VFAQQTALFRDIHTFSILIALPPSVPGGRGTIAGERGGGRVPFPTRRRTLWYSLYIQYVLCADPEAQYVHMAGTLNWNPFYIPVLDPSPSDYFPQANIQKE